MSKINTKQVFWPHEDSGLCGLTTQNITGLAEGPLVQENLSIPSWRTGTTTLYVVLARQAT
jgi:hypothetical protein